MVQADLRAMAWSSIRTISDGPGRVAKLLQQGRDLEAGVLGATTGHQETHITAMTTEADGGMTGVLGEMDTLEKLATGGEANVSI